jgi:hypothetical protein
VAISEWNDNSVGEDLVIIRELSFGGVDGRAKVVLRTSG